MWLPKSSEACLVLHPFQREAIYSELADALGPDHVSVSASDRLIYTGDWSWMSQVWLDRGEQPPLPDFIAHPGTPAEVCAVLQIATRHRLPS